MDTSAETPVRRKIWIDGELVAWEAATIHLLSHSAQRGSLVFDYMSVHETPKGAAVFRLPEHLERFEHSCELVGLELPLPRAKLTEALLATARANPGAKAVKISAYLPSIEIDVVPVDARVSIAIAAYDPAADIVGHKKMEVPAPPRMLKLWIEKERRNRRADIVPPQAKVAANYVSTMTAKARARAAGYDEILLIDEYGQVAEGPTTNLFMVDRDGVLRTPPDTRVLLGVTRSSILEIARAEGNEPREAPIMPDELDEAREVFLTGTTAGVWPVTSIDGRPVGDGEKGPVARALGKRFRRAVSGEDPEFVHWLTLVK